MKHQTAYLLMLLALGCNPGTPTSTAVATNDEKPQSLETHILVINSKPYKLQIADEDAEREKGLMYRTSMPADEGMIFVFSDERPRNFWMKNTPIDLDILYLDQYGKIVSIRTMHAYATNDVPSVEPAKYAVEINAGLAEKNQIKIGQIIDLSALKTNAR